jgi:beta-lactamase regulating signal transducer with metallopeptidase domain
VLLGIGATPLVASLVATLFVMIPNDVLLREHCHPSVGCDAHTPVLAFTGDAVLALGLLAGAVGVTLLVRVVTAYTAHRRTSAVLRQTGLVPDGRGFRVIASERLLALCAGLWRGEIILSSSLIDAMDANGLQVIIDHEAAHARHHDNLARLMLSLLFCPVSSFPAAGLLRDLILAAEQVADQAAARRVGVECVARTLLRAQRLGLRTQHSGFASFEPSALELRIHALYRTCEATRLSLAFSVGLGLFSVAAIALGVDGGHHALESLSGKPF